MPRHTSLPTLHENNNKTKSNQVNRDTIRPSGGTALTCSGSAETSQSLCPPCSSRWISCRGRQRNRKDSSFRHRHPQLSTSLPPSSPSDQNSLFKNGKEMSWQVRRNTDMDRQTDWYTEEQANRQTSNEADRQTSSLKPRDRQVNTHILMIGAELRGI